MIPKTSLVIQFCRNSIIIHLEFITNGALVFFISKHTNIVSTLIKVVKQIILEISASFSKQIVERSVRASFEINRTPIKQVKQKMTTVSQRQVRIILIKEPF